MTYLLRLIQRDTQENVNTPQAPFLTNSPQRLTARDLYHLNRILDQMMTSKLSDEALNASLFFNNVGVELMKANFIDEAVRMLETGLSLLVKPHSVFTIRRKVEQASYVVTMGRDSTVCNENLRVLTMGESESLSLKDLNSENVLKSPVSSRFVFRLRKHEKNVWARETTDLLSAIVAYNFGAAYSEKARQSSRCTLLPKAKKLYRLSYDILAQNGHNEDELLPVHVQCIRLLQLRSLLNLSLESQGQSDASPAIAALMRRTRDAEENLVLSAFLFNSAAPSAAAA